MQKQQMQLDEVSEILKRIKLKLRKKQVDGVDVPDQLLFLVSRLNRQETEIWCNIRTLCDADQDSRQMLQKDIQDKMNTFRKSCAKAMTMLPLD